MNETIALMKEHRSIRRYEDVPLPEGLLEQLVAAGQCASTSSYVQAYSVIRITDREKRAAMAQLAGEQKYVESAPEFLVFCADLNRLKWACEHNGQTFSDGWTELMLIAAVDTALMAQNVMLAAESEGLGGVYIGGIRNNPEEIGRLMKLPDRVFPVFGMCLGYPDQAPAPKPRLPLAAVFMENNYHKPGLKTLDAYDAVVRDYYIERTKGRLDHTWSEQMAVKLSKETRPHMKTYLKSKKVAER